ncbi:hypothetical protein [Mycobacterium sp. 012931]|uniref:hypothetical protein n=1 Tax=Mycobacterium sp. 012931 TaxID=1187065 RepID=UPI001F48EF76|nr:hypothetical protein [Mycobacterium sp. 012931]
MTCIAAVLLGSNSVTQFGPRSVSVQPGAGVMEMPSAMAIAFAEVSVSRAPRTAGGRAVGGLTGWERPDPAGAVASAWPPGSIGGSLVRPVVPLKTINAVTAAAIRTITTMTAATVTGRSRCPTCTPLPGNCSGGGVRGGVAGITAAGSAAVVAPTSTVVLPSSGAGWRASAAVAVPQTWQKAASASIIAPQWAQTWRVPGARANVAAPVRAAWASANSETCSA